MPTDAGMRPLTMRDWSVGAILINSVLPVILAFTWIGAPLVVFVWPGGETAILIAFAVTLVLVFGGAFGAMSRGAAGTLTLEDELEMAQWRAFMQQKVANSWSFSDVERVALERRAFRRAVGVTIDGRRFSLVGSPEDRERAVALLSGDGSRHTR